MIKIDLDDIQKNKITKEMYSFFSSKKISEKVKKLSDFLDIKHCTNTANLFSSVDVDYLLTFGKTELQENINKYNKAILSDSLISGIDEKR